jgi:hypothetical protein
MSCHNSNLRGGRPSRLRRWLIGLPFVVGIYVGLIFLYIYPHKPVDLVGWLLLFFVGIPVSGLLEWLGDRFLNSRAESNASLGRVSAKRITLGLFAFLALIGVAIVFWLLFGPLVGPHFS